jgi:hypothetical protein
MNSVTGLLAIVSLLLALAAGSGPTTQPADGSASTARQTSKLATNHNETLVRDRAPMK